MDSPTQSSETPASPASREKFRRTSWVINKPLQYGMIANTAIFSLGSLLATYALASYTFARLQAFVITHPSDASRPFLQQIEECMTIFKSSVTIGFLIFVIIFTFVNLRLSNRIAGPIFHVMKSMRRARETGILEPVHLRSGDYFRELADEYNTLVEQFGKPPEDHSTSETP